MVTAKGLKTAGSANGFWSNPDIFGVQFFIDL